MIELIEVKSDESYQIATELFKEYAAQIGVDLTFQNFNQELANIKQQYARPKGVLYIAYDKVQTPIGCFGIRSFEDAICELKRMYLKSAYRGLGIGKQLLLKSIALGKELGYTKMRLDTLPTMQSAIGLYQSIGFYEIAPYRFNPIEGTKYFEILLEDQ